jgi:hypothetical protein
LCHNALARTARQRASGGARGVEHVVVVDRARRSPSGDGLSTPVLASPNSVRRALFVAAGALHDDEAAHAGKKITIFELK